MDALVCTSCGRHYCLDEVRWSCECGSLLDIEFEARLDRDRIDAGKPTLWRYREAIPIGCDSSIVSLGEGFTPLREFKLAGRTVLAKEEYISPTGSFKDRGATVLVSKARELGISEAVEDTSGNAGAAIAAYCREAGIGLRVFVPSGALPEKIHRIEEFGAEVKKVKGCRDDCSAAALQAAKRTYYAGHARNPFFLQGTKTFAYEICEQLEWKAPDVVVLPAGNGTLLLGTHIGFKDLIAAGLADRMPKLVGVQAKACAPLFRAFHENLDHVPRVQPADTLADGIAVGAPARGSQVIDAVRESGGNFFAVDDLEIMAAQREVAAKGFQIEPTAAAGIAGLARYLARGEVGDTVVTALTGRGLKSPVSP